MATTETTTLDERLSRLHHEAADDQVAFERFARSAARLGCVPESRDLVASDTRSARRRARKLSLEWVQRRARELAEAEAGEWSYSVTHGGAVPNSYGYPTSTDAVVVIVDPSGLSTTWASELAANKVTLRGAAARACDDDGVADLWDERCGPARKADARACLRRLHREAWLERIGRSIALLAEVRS